MRLHSLAPWSTAAAEVPKKKVTLAHSEWTSCGNDGLRALEGESLALVVFIRRQDASLSRACSTTHAVKGQPSRKGGRIKMSPRALAVRSGL